MRQRKSNPRRADISRGRPSVTLEDDQAKGETGNYLDTLTLASLRSSTPDLFALRQKVGDLEKTVASVVPASELEQRNKHNDLKDTVTQALDDLATGSTFINIRSMT